MTPTAHNSLPAITAAPAPEPATATATLDPWTDPATVAVTKDGRVIRQIDEDDLDCELFLRYQAMAAKAFKQGKGGDRDILSPQFVTASQWLVMQLFEIDGKPLTIDHLTGKPSQNPLAIGGLVVARLSTIASEIASAVPSGKDS